MNYCVKKDFKRLGGEITIPPDKSISHRAIILSSLAKGKSVIGNFSSGRDPHSTLNIIKQLDTETEIYGTTLTVNSTGKFKPASNPLDCGNSGTTMRLVSGILAGQNFNSVLLGDESLSNRPMKRIIEPLELMGAKIRSNNFKSPLEICGSKLHAINYTSKIASAQVKSCILLAGLHAQGTTTYTEPYLSRNHTEIMLKNMGAEINISRNTVSIRQSVLCPLEIDIFGDISSAAYFIAAGLIVPNSKILLKNVGLNPTRTGIIKAVKLMGGNISILNEHETCGELIGDILVQYTENLKSCKISGEIIPELIDEIPIIAVLASQAEGQTIISEAQDLRNKETDRITSTAAELKKIGANIEETSDGMIITGKTTLTGGCEVQTYNDHRIAMSLFIAGLICRNEISINGFEWVNISFPEFESLINSVKIN